VDEEKMNGMPGHIPTDKPVILIKPDINSQYEDMVNILDEMKINDMPIYAMIDITPVDQGYIKATEEANAGGPK